MKYVLLILVVFVSSCTTPPPKPDRSKSYNFHFRRDTVRCDWVMFWQNNILHRSPGYCVFSGYGTDAKPSFYEPQPDQRYFLSDGTAIDSSAVWKVEGKQIEYALDRWR